MAAEQVQPISDAVAKWEYATVIVHRDATAVCMTGHFPALLSVLPSMFVSILSDLDVAT